MEHHQFARTARQAARPVALKALVASLIGAGVLSAAPASAQEEQTVVVTGQRKAAQSAQTLKKNADNVIDSIVADDIGKFPDRNVAEILQRVTGVQVIRGGGEAGAVVIRGLGGLVTLLNGREFFSDSGRSLYLADIPATMLQRIDVHKTQGPDMPEGGTAGVVDVRTNRPFDFKGATLQANLGMTNRNNAGTNNPDVSTMASNRWKTSIGEVGALVGLSYQRGRYADEVAFAGEPAVIDRGIMGTNFLGRFMGNGDRKRQALNFALQWRPSSTFEVFTEGFRTNIDHRFQNNFLLGFPPNFRGATITTKPNTNYLDTITLLNQDHGGFTSTQAFQHDVTNEQYAVGARWDATPAVRVTSELATTKSYFDERRVIFDMDYTAHGFKGAVREGGGYVDFPGTNMRDPIDANFRVAGGKDIADNRGGSNVDWRSDVTWDTTDNGVLNFVKELSAGVRLAKRKAYSQANKDMWWNFGPNQGRNVSNFPGLVGLSAPTGGDYGVSQYIVADKNYLLDNTAEVRKILTGSSAALGLDPLSYFSDVEKTSSFYTKAKFEFNAGVPISGWLGARLVRTQQNLKGNSSILGVEKPVDVDTSRNDVLPSMGLRVDFTPKLVGRLIGGKTIERPNFVDYNPALRLFPPGTPVAGQAPVPGNGSAGNPMLRPTRSTNVDVALEWYFANTGSLTATVFEHKFIDRLSGKANVEVIEGQAYNVSRLYNLSKANLEGAELSYHQFFDGLPGMLSGLGMEANFTYIQGKETNLDGTESPFRGLSKRSYNLIGLYERGPWSARVAYNWRAKFLAEDRYRGNQTLNLYVAPLRTLDASVTYKIDKHFSLTLDGNNLVDMPYHDYFNENPGLVRDTRRYDRAVGLALHYKY